MRRELKRAKQVVAELERIAQEVRRNLATHHSSVLHFKDRLAELGADPDATATRHVCHEAERLLKPTMRLVSQMASAYDELRQQSSMLMSFTEVRTDALTGLSNRRAFDEALTSLLAMKKRYKSAFSVAIFDIDYFKKVNDELGHLHGDQVLKQVAELLEVCVRETDIVARYGGEEFIVIMPETELAGARILAQRIQRMVEAESDVTISGGLAAALSGDEQRTLLARADEALYAAKAAGRNGVYQHDGLEIVPINGLCPAPDAAALVS
jgi:diguanylate cyclase